jgi:hypothetical protein
MRTTLNLPDPLFREVKTRAIQQGVKLKDLLAVYIEAGLRGVPAQAAPPTLEGGHIPLPVAFERVPGASPIPYRTNAELYALLENEDVARQLRVAESSRPET